MKQQEAETLAAAGVIRFASILESSGGGWRVYVYGADYSEKVGRSDPGIETARGGLRTWASLDTAYRWIRALPAPQPIRVEISD